jgi:hypothetical protein
MVLIFITTLMIKQNACLMTIHDILQSGTQLNIKTRVVI